MRLSLVKYRYGHERASTGLRDHARRQKALPGPPASAGERQLCGSHFNTAIARFWPISDRFASPNPPFSETNPVPSASGKSRRGAVGGERQLCGHQKSRPLEPIRWKYPNKSLGSPLRIGTAESMQKNWTVQCLQAVRLNCNELDRLKLGRKISVIDKSAGLNSYKFTEGRAFGIKGQGHLGRQAMSERLVYGHFQLGVRNF